MPGRRKNTERPPGLDGLSAIVSVTYRLVPGAEQGLVKTCQVLPQATEARYATWQVFALIDQWQPGPP